MLQEAGEVVNGPRQDAYGDPVETCERIGMAWAALLGVPEIPAATVARMMTALKLVRAEAAPDGVYVRDNDVDGAGYLEIAARAAAQEREDAECAEGSCGRPFDSASWSVAVDPALPDNCVAFVGPAFPGEVAMQVEGERERATSRYTHLFVVPGGEPA